MKPFTKNYNFRLCFWICVICIAAVGLTAWAQSGNVTLNGFVHDPTGAAVPGAQVTALNRQTGLRKVATTDSAGRFTIQNIPPDDYDVRASSKGFGTAEHLNIALLVGTTVNLDFALKVASAATTVTVEGTAPAVDTTTSQLSLVVEPQELDNLPTIDRSFSDLAALSPGVEVATTSSSVNGNESIEIGASQSYQTGFIVDGTSTEKDQNGGEFLNFAQDWIQEFNLISLQPPAQYGGAQGGYVNAITRSGTNQIHGRAYGYFQNATLNATPLFLPKSESTKPPYNLQRIGGMVGGPIKKGKLFYFGGYEYYNNTTSIPVVVPAAFVSPTATSGVFPQDNETSIAMLKLNAALGANNSLMLRANYERDYDTNSGIGAGASGNMTTLGAATNQHVPAEVFAASWDSTLSAKSLNNLSFTYNRYMQTIECQYAAAVGSYTGGGSQANPAGNPVGWWTEANYPEAGGIVTGCGRWGAQGTSDMRIYETLTRVSGSHHLTIGGEMDRWGLITPSLRDIIDGDYTSDGLVPFSQSDASTYPIAYSNSYQTKLNYNLYGWSFGFFAQDSWQTTKKLTLNVGLRYDMDLSANALNPWVPAGLNKLTNDYTEVAPRFGFALAPFNNSNTVIRGGFGVFYDQSHFNLYGAYMPKTALAIESFSLNAVTSSLNPYCYGTTSCQSGVPVQYQNYVKEALAYSWANYTNPNFDNQTITLGGNTYFIPQPTIVGAGGVPQPAPTAGIYNVTPNFTVPGNMQANIGIAHNFSRTWNASADFVYVRGFNQMIIYNANVNQSDDLINPAYTSINTWGNGGYYTNRSVRVESTWQTHRGDALRLAYSLGWADDNSIDGFGLTSAGKPATDPFDLDLDYGPSSLDARNVLNITGLYHLPWGFSLAPIVAYTSALPYTATTTQRVAGCLSYYNQCYPVGYSKDSLRGDSTISVNGRVAETLKLGEKRDVAFMLEGYNLFNRANYGTDYVTNVQSTTFKQPNGIATAMRQLQLGVKFDF